MVFVTLKLLNAYVFQMDFNIYDEYLGGIGSRTSRGPITRARGRGAQLMLHRYLRQIKEITDTLIELDELIPSRSDSVWMNIVRVKLGDSMQNLELLRLSMSSFFQYINEQCIDV